MFCVSKKSTVGRMGFLCLVVLSIAAVSCQKEQVMPQPRAELKHQLPLAGPAVSIDEDDEDHPPKDVNDGGRGN